MRFGGEVVAKAEGLGRGIGAVGDDGAEAGVDEPDEGDAKIEVKLDLLVDLVLGVGGGEDLDGKNGGAFEVGNAQTAGDHLGGDVGHVDADQCVGVGREPEAGLSPDNQAPRLGLGVEPLIQKATQADLDAAMGSITSGQRLLPKLASDQFAARACVGKRFKLGGCPGARDGCNAHQGPGSWRLGWLERQ